MARQNHRVLTLLPHSLSSTATSPLSDSYREVGDFGIIAVPFDLGIISLCMRYRTIETSAAAPHSARPYEPYVYCKYEYLPASRLPAGRAGARGGTRVRGTQCAA